MNSKHPCFNKGAASQFGRAHLPVAPLCNIQCGFCNRKYSCVNESRPGVTAKVVTPNEACRLLCKASETMPGLSVAGIAGPGDPLANPSETLETLRLVKAALPDLLLCLSTNGFALPEYANELANLGVRHLTVTVNAVDPVIGAKIYLNVAGLTGYEAAEGLLEKQLAGVALAKSLSMTVKINMVIIPGVNEDHAPAVARSLAALGADLMNCIPLAPVGGTAFGAIMEPTPELMANIRAEAEKWLPQMRHCSRCRADALGLLGDKSSLTGFYQPKYGRRCGIMPD